MRSASKKLRRMGGIATAIAVFIVFSALYLLFILLGGGILLYSFYSNPKNEDIYSLSVIYDEQVLHNIDSDEANNEHGLYISFEYLSEIGNFGLAPNVNTYNIFCVFVYFCIICGFIRVQICRYTTRQRVYTCYSSIHTINRWNHFIKVFIRYSCTFFGNNAFL